MALQPVRDPKAVFLFVARRQFPWLAPAIQEDFQQEVALFVHEVSLGRVEEYLHHATHVKLFTEVHDMRELVRAARLRLTHIAARYAYRRADREKECHGHVAILHETEERTAMGEAGDAWL